MSLINFIAVLLCAAILLKIVADIIAFELSTRHILSAPQIEQDDVEAWATGSRRLHIVIPLLNEQNRFDELAAQFQRILEEYPYTTLNFVTTARELIADQDNKITTMGLIDRFIFVQEAKFRERIRRMHYPNVNQTIVEQLNYGLRVVLKQSGDRDFVLFYNADSVISPDDIGLFAREICDHQPAAIQQSALFLNNFEALINNGQFICAADAIFQSRWTLYREIPRYLFSSHNSLGIPISIRRLVFQHCTTHGLAVNVKVMRKLGGFPVTRFGLEDSAVGFALGVRHLQIRSLSSLENADAATNVRSLIMQKSTWVRAAWGTIEYYFDAIRSQANQLTAFAFLLQGVYMSLKWSLGIPLFIVALVWADSTTRTVLIIGYLGMAYIPYLQIYFLWRKLPQDTFPIVSLGEYLRVAPAMLGAPFVHGTVGLLGLVRLIKQVVLRESFKQIKTK